MDKKDPLEEFIKEGKYFSIDELKNRIAKMDIDELDYSEHPRAHYIDIYDRLTLIQENRDLLKYYLKIDPNIFQKKLRARKNENPNETLEAKKAKIEKKPEVPTSKYDLPPQHMLDLLVPNKKEEYNNSMTGQQRKDFNTVSFNSNLKDIQTECRNSNSKNKEQENIQMKKELIQLKKDVDKFAFNIINKIDEKKGVIQNGNQNIVKNNNFQEADKPATKPIIKTEEQARSELKNNQIINDKFEKINEINSQNVDINNPIQINDSFILIHEPNKDFIPVAKQKLSTNLNKFDPNTPSAFTKMQSNNSLNNLNDASKRPEKMIIDSFPSEQIDPDNRPNDDGIFELI
jgi:hypothetical protein